MVRITKFWLERWSYGKKNKATVRIIKQDKKNESMFRSMKLRLKQGNIAYLNEATSRRTRLQLEEWKDE